MGLVHPTLASQSPRRIIAGPAVAMERAVGMPQFFPSGSTVDCQMSLPPHSSTCCMYFGMCLYRASLGTSRIAPICCSGKAYPIQRSGMSPEAMRTLICAVSFQSTVQGLIVMLKWSSMYFCTRELSGVGLPRLL